MRILACLSFLVLQVALPGFAQSDFRDGYIVTAEGDTVRGKVNYASGLYKECRFRSTERDETFTPSQLRGYGFHEDKIFVSRSPDPAKPDSVLVFFEVIVRGTVSLYRLEGAFFLEKGADFVRLTNPTEKVKINGEEVTRRSRRFAQIANMMVADCPETKKMVEKLGLNERNLTELVETYNRCKGNEFVSFKAKKPWLKTVIGVEAGVSYSTLKVDVTSYENNYLSGTYEASVTPLGGLKLEFSSPRLKENMAFLTGVYYTNPKYYNYSTYPVVGGVQYNYVSIDVSQFKIPLGVRFELLPTRYAPYIIAGLMNTLLASSNTSWISETESNGLVTFNESEAVILTSYQPGVFFGCGVTRNLSSRLFGFVEFRYESLKELFIPSYNLSEVNSSVSYFQLTAGIRF